MPVITYVCSNCGGDLTFSPEKQKFECKYCGSFFEKEELESKEQKPTNDQIERENSNEERDWDGAVLFECPSCGAEIITDNTVAATECVYCHNPVVLSGRLDGKYLPSRLIPFKFNRDTAIEKFLAWTKKKYFLPRDFFSEQQVEKLTGVYYPYWIVDCDTHACYTGEGKTVSTWTTGNTRYTNTKIFNVYREGDIHLEDIVKSGLKKVNKRLVENVQPFNEQELVPFSMTYLSGFRAEKRDIERQELESEVNQDVKVFSEKIITETASGYSLIDNKHFTYNVTNIDWEYGLLPVWAMTYNYKGTMYYYSMNGQKGKTVGKLPVDKKKLMLVSLIASLVALVFSLLGGYLI